MLRVSPVILLLSALALSGADKPDIAPFARPCCSQDAYTLQTTFDYRHPSGLARAGEDIGGKVADAKQVERSAPKAGAGWLVVALLG